MSIWPSTVLWAHIPAKHVHRIQLAPQSAAAPLAGSHCARVPEKPVARPKLAVVRAQVVSSFNMAGLVDGITQDMINRIEYRCPKDRGGGGVVSLAHRTGPTLHHPPPRSEKYSDAAYDYRE